MNMYEPTREPYLPKLNRPTNVSKQVENNNATQLGPQVLGSSVLSPLGPRVLGSSVLSPLPINLQEYEAEDV